MFSLTSKDLINVGIFSAIYILIVFAIAMLGFIPVLMVTYPVYIPLVAGIPFMLFITKVEKFGMITLMGFICGLVMFISGHTWIPLLTGFISGLLGDLIIKKGDYKVFKYIAVGYGVFANWLIGGFLPFWVMREEFFATIRASFGNEYANQVAILTPEWLPYVIVILIIISGIAGAFLGRSVLKKHFQRAGIV